MKPFAVPHQLVPHQLVPHRLALALLVPHQLVPHRLVLALLVLAQLALALLTLACSGDPSPGSRPESGPALLDLGSSPVESGLPVTDVPPRASETSSSVPCGEFSESSRFVCSKDGNSRGKCIDGQGTIEPCARGCLRYKAPANDVCLSTTTSWSCSGVQGTAKVENGDFYITYFGCWIDASGVHHKDPNDNCIPGCLPYAKTAKLCESSWTGQQCEEKVAWFTANNGRFPCLSRLRITNPANGRTVIAVVLDGGPACSAEQKIQKAMLDVSAPAFNYLFNDGKTWSTKSSVHVVEVDPSFPLGIQP